MSNYNSQLQSNNTDLQRVLQTLQNKAAGGEQATPVISVNSTNGLITATAGTKSSTHQLAFQPAKTITPKSTSQIAVSSGYYTGGNIVVAAIPSTYVQPNGTLNVTRNGIYNIKNYVSVNVGVAGGDGDTSIEDSLVTGAVSNYTNAKVATIRTGAFYNCYNLTTVNFPNATTIGESAFQGCYKLTTVDFPNVTTISDSAFKGCIDLTTVSFPNATTISNYAFQNCIDLTTVSFPNATTIGNSAFWYCSSLTTVNFPNATTIGFSAFLRCSKLTTASFSNAMTIDYGAFQGCYNLTSLYLTGSIVCTLSDSAVFYSTPIGGYSSSAGTYGSIYVPGSLLTAYKTATNWAYFSRRFVAYDQGADAG